MKETNNFKTLKENPSYFGNFLNMARYNAFLIIQELIERFNIKGKKKHIHENNYYDVLQGFYKDNKAKADWNTKFVESLKKKFPFLWYLGTEEGNNELVVDTLCNCFKNLHDLRNYYTHYGNAKKWNSQTMINLAPIFDFVVNEKLPNRFKELVGTDLYEEFCSETKEIEFYKLKDKSGNFTPLGLVFFTCMFLERKYSEQFLRGLKIVQNEDPAKTNLLSNCLTTLHTKLPYNPLESSDILLTMLNELGRCPGQLYRVLSDDDREKFKSGDNKNENISYYNTDIDAGKTLMKRSKDRFPYFAMKFMDEFNYFDSLRFQVQVCKWIKDKYIKNIDGQERDRFIMEPLNIFERITDLTESKMEGDAGNENKWATDKGQEHIYQFAPHYNYGNNIIPIKIKRKENTKVLPFLQPKKSDSFPYYYMPKKEVPDAILSTYEIQNLFFYQYLYKNGFINKSAEELISQFIESFFKLAKDIKDEKIKPLFVPPFYERTKGGKFKAPELGRLKEHAKWLQEIIPHEEDIKRLRQKEKNLADDLKRIAQIEKYNESKTQMDTLLQEKYNYQLKALPDDLREYLIGYKTRKFSDYFKQKVENLEKETKERLEQTELLKLLYDFEDKEFPFKPIHKPENFRSTNPKVNKNELTTDEKKNRKYENNLRRLDGDIVKKYGIGLSGLPRKIKDYLTGQITTPPDAEYLDKIIRIRGREQRIGNLALWFTKDIVLLKKHKYIDADKGKTDQPTKDQYNVLQAKLALFPLHKETLKDFFKEINLIENTNGFNHPFLAKLNPKEFKTGFGFYQAYLDEKLVWIEREFKKTFTTKYGKKKIVIKDISKHEEKQTIEKYDHFFKLSEKGWNQKQYEYKDKHENIQRIPVNLPRGLFNTAIFKALKDKNFEIDGIIENGELKPDNVVYCLQKFMEHHPDFKEKNAQKFYSDYERYSFEDDDENPGESRLVESKRLLIKLNDRINDLAKFKKRRKDTETEYRNFKKKRTRILENEKDIRYVTSNDRALWIMSKSAMVEKWKMPVDELGNLNLRLENVGYDLPEEVADEATGRKEKNVLDVKVPMSISIDLKNSDRKVEIVEKLPVKKHGTFRRIMKDNRVASIADFVQSDTITLKKIEEELRYYDENRNEIFSLIYDFEKQIIENESLKNELHSIWESSVGNESDFSKKGFYDHYHFIKLIQNKLGDEIELPINLAVLDKFRNQICHNNILSSETIGKIEEGEKLSNAFNNFKTKIDENKIVESQFDLAKQTYNKILNLLIQA